MYDAKTMEEFGACAAAIRNGITSQDHLVNWVWLHEWKARLEIFQQFGDEDIIISAVYAKVDGND